MSSFWTQSIKCTKYGTLLSHGLKNATTHIKVHICSATLQSKSGSLRVNSFTWRTGKVQFCFLKMKLGTCVYILEDQESILGIVGAIEGYVRLS